MILFRRLALHRFAPKHPPARQVSPASGELVAAYDGMLPASLLKLWREKGLGFYDGLQLALIDPRIWQPVLDRWIISPPDTAVRIPIALTPFGTLLYYRKLSTTRRRRGLHRSRVERNRRFVLEPRRILQQDALRSEPARRHRFARDVMGRSERYFRRVVLGDAFVEEPSDGRTAPPFVDLPKTLQALTHVEPLTATITHVAEPDPDEEDEGAGTVMCTLDLGEEDGLRHNMPLYSPRDTGRRLRGWVWQMTPHACKAGVKYQRGQDGAIEHGPAVGNVLTTRAPGK